jgi:hypothetical protein
MPLFVTAYGTNFGLFCLEKATPALNPEAVLLQDYVKPRWQM